MCRKVGILRFLTIAGCLLILAGPIAPRVGETAVQSAAPAPATENATGTAEATPSEPEPGLSPEMTALRDRVRRVVTSYSQRPWNTRDNTPGDVIQVGLAFGARGEVRQSSTSGKRINAIGCLCWNYPCAGYRLLQIGEGRLMARIGYGLQQVPSQFLAMLATSGVSADYEIRVGGVSASVAHLVKHEMLDTRSGTDLSLKLIGLSHYLEDQRPWKSRLGEDWSVERLIEEELGRSADAGNCSVTNRLLGLSYAVQQRIKRKRPVEGRFLDARKHVRKYQEYTWKLQNPDGSWHPRFFAVMGTSRDVAGSLNSTGHILEWLVFSLPEDELQDPRVVRSVDYLTGVLEKRSSRQSPASISARDLAGTMHALHALSIYDRRVFKPWDPEQPKPETEDAPGGQDAS